MHVFLHAACGCSHLYQLSKFYVKQIYHDVHKTDAAADGSYVRDDGGVLSDHEDREGIEALLDEPQDLLKHYLVLLVPYDRDYQEKEMTSERLIPFHIQLYENSPIKDIFKRISLIQYKECHTCAYALNNSITPRLSSAFGSLPFSN